MDWWEVLKGGLLLLLTFVQVIIIPMIMRLMNKVDTVEIHTNSMKDDLVKATKALGENVGYAKGIEEGKSGTNLG